MAAAAERKRERERERERKMLNSHLDRSISPKADNENDGARPQTKKGIKINPLVLATGQSLASYI
jgi:hypothetical protein